VDFNGSFLARVRDLAGANPIILVVTKVIICMLESNIIIPCVVFTMK
jgi:nitric-oxide synthase